MCYKSASVCHNKVRCHRMFDPIHDLRRSSLQKCPKIPTNGLYTCSKDARAKDSQKCKLLCRKGLTPNRKGTKCLDLKNDPYHCGAVSVPSTQAKSLNTEICICRRVTSARTLTTDTARGFARTENALEVSSTHRHTSGGH